MVAVNIFTTMSYDQALNMNTASNKPGNNAGSQMPRRPKPETQARLLHGGPTINQAAGNEIVFNM